TTTRLLEQLLTPYAPFGFPKLALVDLPHDFAQPVLSRIGFGIDGRDLAHAVTMLFGDDGQVRLAPITLNARFARLQIRALPLLVDVCTTPQHLGASSAGLLELNAELTLEISEPLHVPPKGIHALGYRGGLDSAGRCLTDQGGLGAPDAVQL